MRTAPAPDDPPPDLAGTWQLDAEPVEALPESEMPVDDLPARPPSPPSASEPPPAEIPPSPEQLIEAMLFVGGHPLTSEAVCAAIRGLTRERFNEAIDALARQYRRQRRPYTVQLREGGYILTVLPEYRSLREKLFGGPKETRLGQPALDVLSVVAYRQPVSKAEVDALRGTDSGGILRQLVRLGLVAVQHRAEAGSKAVRYGTTSRFLHVFGLNSLDELPRMGDTTLV